jgi:hypothetical protein
MRDIKSMVCETSALDAAEVCSRETELEPDALTRLFCYWL